MTKIWTVGSVALSIGVSPGVSPALAVEGTMSPAPQETRSLDAFANANKGCREWTDGCAVCLRKDGGTFACSLPGIACQPTDLICRSP